MRGGRYGPGAARHFDERQGNPMKHTVITIARQYGSGGRVIGKKLAEELGVPFYDKELITLAAQKSGASSEVLENVDEKAANSLLYAFCMGGVGAMMNLNAGNLPINDSLYLTQSQIIRDAAAEGSCVVVGRCADYILRENPHRISFFIYADMEHRMDRVKNVYGVEEDKLEEYILKKDKQRANYYNYYTSRKWYRFENYDLSVDSGTLGIDNTVQIMKQYIQLRSGE